MATAKAAASQALARSDFSEGTTFALLIDKSAGAGNGCDLGLSFGSDVALPPPVVPTVVADAGAAVPLPTVPAPLPVANAVTGLPAGPADAQVLLDGLPAAVSPGVPSAMPVVNAVTASSTIMQAQQATASANVPAVYADASAPAALPSGPVASATITGGGGGSAPLTLLPVVPQPVAAGDVVGLILQNPAATTLPQEYVSFGSSFAEGQVPAGEGLVAIINGAQVPMQVDAKTHYADGSVRFAVLTLQQPALGANASAGVLLRLTKTPATGASVDLSALAHGGSANFSMTVTLSGLTETQGTGAGATSIPLANQTIEVGSLLQTVLSTPSAFWLQGPLASEARFDVLVDPNGATPTNPLHLTFDVRRYADGTVFVDAQFNADIAGNAALGTQPIALTYNVAITENGSTVLQQSGITQYQYQTWDQQIWSNGTPGVNIQQDVGALEATGAVQNYDYTAGLNTSQVNTEASRLGTSQFGILQGGYIEQYMPLTGGRPDIGPQPKWMTQWLVTQNASAAQYAQAQAQAAGAVPWSYWNQSAGWDPTQQAFLTSTANPTLWLNSGGGGGSTSVAQAPQTGLNGASGWTPDPAHQPDVAYTAYLMTGDRRYLDQLNAQASFDVLEDNPTARGNNGAGSNVASGPLRQIAWDLREIVEAATANPDGSAERQYFTHAAAQTLGYLLQEAANANEGSVSGWFEQPNGRDPPGSIDPWWQDYFASTLGLAAGLGIVGARELLAWQTGFLAGRFLNAANGFDPYNGIAYKLITYDGTQGSLFIPETGTPLQSWAQVQAASEANNDIGSPTNTVLNPSSDYQAQAKASLAESITYTGSTKAIEAYGWLQAYATAANTALYQQDPTFDIVPRLSDGQLLANNQVFVRNDTGASPVTVRGGGSDQLIYEEGNAPAKIVGGAGINILFAGGGTTTLVGGPASDYLFGGSGATTFQSGSGNDYIQVQADTVNNTATWTPAPGATIILSASDTGHDTVAGFRPAIDRLSISGITPAALSASATNTQGGSIILHLSSSHDVTLLGVATAANLIIG